MVVRRILLQNSTYTLKDSLGKVHNHPPVLGSLDKIKIMSDTKRKWIVIGPKYGLNISLIRYICKQKDVI